MIVVAWYYDTADGLVEFYVKKARVRMRGRVFVILLCYFAKIYI